MLDDNVAHFHPDRRRGAPKRGAALLAGLLRCGRCGRKLKVGYSGKNAAVPRYQCHRARLDHLAPKCIAFGGLSVDQAVAREILEVVRPCAVDAARRAVSQAAARHQERIEALSLELEAARYAAELAGRRYDAMDPDNRLVAGELERRWDEALQKVRDLERKLDQGSVRETPEETSFEDLTDLELDLDRAWEAAETDPRLRKRILRALIEEIVVDIDSEASEVVDRRRHRLRSQRGRPRDSLEGRRARRAADPAASKGTEWIAHEPRRGRCHPRAGSHLE
jgi:hypothetical protein